MMPKGVEHKTTGKFGFSTPGVIHSLMPKGVEHKSTGLTSICIPGCDPFVDAERR